MITRTYPVWCRAADLDLLVPAGSRHRIVFLPKGPEFGPSADFFSWPLDLDDFATGASEYDSISDEGYCPCGATLPGWDGTAGHLLRLIHHHCETSAHPLPRYER